MSRMAKCLSLLNVMLISLTVVNVGYGQASNTWLSAGQMTQARTGAVAVLLQDGRILITGGADANGVPLTSAEFFNPATEVFSATPAMNVPRANHAAIVLTTGDVLVTGGVTDAGGDYTNTAELFSATTQQWTELPSMLPQGVAGHAMTLLADGNVLIAGGASTTGPVGALLLFNAADNSITSSGTLQTARTNAAAAAMPDGRVLIAGGTDINNNILSSTEIFVYSPSTLSGTVSAGPALTYPRTAATATSTYDGVAVVGGYNIQNGTQTDLGTAEIFSQWTNTFRVVSGATPRSGHFAVKLPNNGAILAMGGSGGQAVDLLEPWANGTAGAFVAAANSLSNPTGGYAVPATLGSILAAGGEGSAASDAELYWFPTIATDQPDYAPATPVVMTGTGFQPGESVDLHLHEWVNQTVTDLPDYTVLVGSNGIFSFTGYAPTTSDVGARYHLTAIGETSGLQAQTIFTDGNDTISFATSGLPAGTSVTVNYYPKNTQQSTGGNVTFGSPGPSSGQGETPGQHLSYTFPASVTVSGATYTLTTTPPPSVSPSASSCSSPQSGYAYCFVASSAGNVSYTVTGTYVLPTTPVTASLTASNKTYDGTTNEPNSNMSCSLTGVHSGDTVTCTASSGSFASSDVGTGITVTATVSLGGADAAKYTLGAAGTSVSSISANASANITPLAVTLSAGSYSGTYDANTHALTDCSSNSPTFVTCTNSPSGPVGPDVVSTPVAVTPVPVYAKGNSSDYTVTSNNGSWSITPLAVTLSAGSYSGTYDGNTHALSACTSTESSFVTCTNSPAGPAGPDVVNTPVTVTPTAVFGKGNSGDYTISTSNGSWSITPLAVTLTGGSYSGIYDGKPHGLSACSSSAPTLLPCTNNPAGPVGPDAIAAPVAVSPTPTYGSAIPSDFTITSNNGSWSITPLAVTLTGGSYSGTYDGNTHALPTCSSSSTLLSCTNNPAGPLGPDVGGPTPVTPVPVYGTAIAADFTITSNNGSWSITPLPVTLTGGNYSGIYDGNSHELSGCTSSSTLLSCTNNPAGPVGADVGGPTPVVPVPVYGLAIAADFTITSNNGSWSITPLAVTLHAGSYSGTYDATSHALSTCTSSASGFVTCTNNPVGPVGPGVGTGAVTPSPNYIQGNSGDYNLTSDNGSWSITTAAVTATLHASDKIYDGITDEPDSKMSCTLAGVLTADDGKVTCTPSNGSFSSADVGTWPVTATVTINGLAAGNYTLGAAATAVSSTSANTTASITPLAVTITAGSYSGTYDGKTHVLTDCASSAPTFITCANSPAGPVGPDVTATIQTVSPMPNYVQGNASDYKITSNDGSWSITPLPVTITAGVYNGTYDGKTHVLTDCASSASSFVTCANSPTGPVGPDVIAGPVTVTPVLTYVQGNAGDYTLSLTNGSWSITPLTVTVTAGGYSGVYDGKTHALTDCTTSASGFVTCVNSPVGPVGPDVSAGPVTVTPVPTYVQGNATDYKIDSSNGSWSITALPVTLTAGSYSGAYDGASHDLPACTSSAASFVTCTNNPTGPEKNAGTGTVTPVPSYVQGISGDYSISNNNGTWNITAVPLTITSDSKSMILDGALPTFTATYNGFVGTDGPNSLTGALNCSSGTNGQTIGVFTIACSGQSSTNYTISYKNTGKLTVSYAPLGGTCDGVAGHQILQPIDPGGLSVFKSSSTTPAKFRVCDAKGVSIGTAGVVQSFQVIGVLAGTTGTPDLDVPSTTPDTMFRWDPTGQQWIFNISNKNLGPTNQTYLFLITLNDGSTIPFQYGLK